MKVSSSELCPKQALRRLSGIPTVQAPKEWLLQSEVDRSCSVMPAFWLTWSWSTKEASFCLCGQKFFPWNSKPLLETGVPKACPNWPLCSSFWVLESCTSYPIAKNSVTAPHKRGGHCNRSPRQCCQGRRNHPVHKMRLIIELNVIFKRLKSERQELT